MEVTIELVINGAVACSVAEPEGWRDVLARTLEEREWVLHQLRWNGEVVDLDEALRLSSSIDDEVTQTVDVVAGPAVVDEGAVTEQLLATLPRFLQHFERVAEEFSRGEWRNALPSLEALLVEMQWVVEGFRRLHEPIITPAQIQKWLTVLSEMEDPLKRQSWVEVSDLLLYELVPLLQQWETSARSGAR